MSLSDFLSLVEEATLYVVFYLSRKYNINKTVRDLAETFKENELFKLSFSIRHCKKLAKEPSGIDHDKHNKIDLLLEILRLPHNEVQNFLSKVLKKCKAIFEYNLEKFEEKMTILLGIMSFIPIVIALSTFFNIISFYEGGMIMIVLYIILYHFIPLFHNNMLKTNIIMWSFFLSIMGGTSISLFLQKIIFSKVLAMMLILLLFICYFWFKGRAGQEDSYKKLLRRISQMEALLSWLQKNVRGGLNFEYATKCFIRKYGKDLEITRNTLPLWIFLKRHALKLNSENTFLGNLNVAYRNYDLENLEHIIETFFAVLHNNSILVTNLYHKIKMLKFKANIIQYISSFSVSAILALVTVFKNANSDIVFFITVFLFSQMLLSYKMGISNRNIELLKYTKIQVSFSLLIFLLLEFIVKRI